MGKVYGKPGLVESRISIPGVRSVKKLAKLEAKMYFVKKPVKGPYKPPEEGRRGKKVNNSSSIAQDNRGCSSVTPDIL